MISLTDNLKMGIAGLVLSVVTVLPLNAQKYESDYIKKHNLDYCISGKGIKSNSYYLKKEKEDDNCFSKAGRKNNSNSLKKEKEKNYCVSNQYNKYHKNLHKLMGKK